MANFNRNRRRSSNNDGQGKPKSVSTNTHRFFSPVYEGEKTALTVSIWKNYVYIQIAFQLEKQGENGQVFDYDNGYNVGLTDTQVLTLINGIKSLKKSNKFTNIAVASTYVLRVTKPSEDFGWLIEIIDKDKKKVNVIQHEFNKESEEQTIYLNYDEEKDDYEQMKTYPDMEFDSFVNVLQAAYDALISGVCHPLSNLIFTNNKIYSSVLNLLNSDSNNTANSRASFKRSSIGSKSSNDVPSGRARLTSKKNSTKEKDEDNDDLNDSYDETLDESSVSMDDVDDILNEDD